MVTLGGEQEVHHHKLLVRERLPLSQPSSARSLSCLVNGLLTILAQLLTGQSLSFGRLFPFPFGHFNDLALANSS